MGHEHQFPEVIPDWQRPLRLPAHIEVCRCRPETALAGAAGAWELCFRLAAEIPPDWELYLQLRGGRNSKGGFLDLVLPTEDTPGNATAWTRSGMSVGVGRGPVQGTLSLRREGKLEKGEELIVRLGSPEMPCRAFPIRQLNKFFVVYTPQLFTADNRDEADGDLRDRKGKQPHLPGPGSVWSQRTAVCIVGACTMHVLGGPPDHLRAYIPSHCVPGVQVPVLVHPQDTRCNLSAWRPGRIGIYHNGVRLSSINLPVKGSTCLKVATSLPQPGLYRLVVRDEDNGLETITNPTQCSIDLKGPHPYWAMIHGHTEMSDGTGSLYNYFRQMRDEALLDITASSDHDHRYEASDAFWQITCEAVAKWNEPGRMVTFLGYEWAKWRKNGDGDRNVYYRHDYRPLYRSDDDEYPTPPELFHALREETALIIPHHTAHGGNFCDWKDHDPLHERLIEIFQVRGSYERRDDNPLPENTGQPVYEGGYVSEALLKGWRVGFTAGGDDHIGQAGFDYPMSEEKDAYKAGLTAVLAEDLTRDDVWDALWHRRTIATSGPRILLNYTLNGHLPGSEIQADDCPDVRTERRLYVEFHGTAPVDRMDIIRNNVIVHTSRPDQLDGALEWSDNAPLEDIVIRESPFRETPFCYYYVRILQHDHEMAWASPVWIDVSL